MSIRRFERFETTGLVESYIHGDGKIGVLVEIEGEIANLQKIYVCKLQLQTRIFR